MKGTFIWNLPNKLGLGLTNPEGAKNELHNSWRFLKKHFR
jgi:hypothetical protein